MLYIRFMKTEVRTTYRCEHCKKIYFRKYFALRHEERCNKNPINFRPCFNCPQLIMKNVTIYDEYFRSKSSILFCRKDDCGVYPPEVEYKGNALDTEYDNIPMPKQCDWYDDWIIKERIKKFVKMP